MQPTDVNQAQPEQEPAQPPRGRQFLRVFFSIVEFFGTVALLVFLILGFGLQSYHVVGESMTPTLQDGDRLIISKLGKTVAWFERGEYQPKRGDIIVFRKPEEGDIQIIKRVIGLPGDRVVLENGKFTIYNKENPQGFNPDLAYDRDKKLAYTTGNVDETIPEGRLFVSGDNRVPGGSRDSRSDLGLVELEDIVGKLILRIAPLDQARSF